MAQNFWLASFAFTACFVLTLVISLATRRTKTDEELKGLVYSLTPKMKDEEKAWYLRPRCSGVVLLDLLRDSQHHLLVKKGTHLWVSIFAGQSASCSPSSARCSSSTAVATISDPEVYQRSLDININLAGAWCCWSSGPPCSCMAWRASRLPPE